MTHYYTTDERYLFAFETMLHSYIQSKNYTSVRYEMLEDRKEIRIYIQNNGVNSGCNIRITRDMDLHHVFEHTVEFIESKIDHKPKTSLYDFLDNRSDRDVDEGLKRRAIVLDEMVRSYARTKGYELHYNSTDVNLRKYNFSNGETSCSWCVVIAKTMNLYRDFDRLVQAVESKLNPTVDVGHRTRDSMDALSYSYSYMKPIAEGCTCKVTRNGLEISGQLTDHGKMFVTMGRKNGKTLATEFLDKEFHIPPIQKSGRFPWGHFIPEIKDVIFNDPATIVFWKDGTKTVVKCQNGEGYDPEKGLAMAISKKTLGNERDYYHTFLKWLKKYEKENPTLSFDGGQFLRALIREARVKHFSNSDTPKDNLNVDPIV